jgi:hypothetical protein
MGRTPRSPTTRPAGLDEAPEPQRTRVNERDVRDFCLALCDVATAADRENEVLRKFALLVPVLDERQRVLWMAMAARSDRGGTIEVTRGVDELDSGATDSGRVRRAGAGRKRAETARTVTRILRSC